MRRFTFALLTLPLLLAGCDLLGIETASAVNAKREAEGKAIGAGCRHAARSIEQCFAHNRRADKAAIFTGWREMEDYMRENNIAPVPAVEDTTVAAAPGANGAGSVDAPAAASGGRTGQP